MKNILPVMQKPGSLETRTLGLLLMLIILACAMLSCAPKKVQEAPNAAQIIPPAQEFVNQLVQKDYTGAAKKFDDTMMKALPPDKLQSTWETLLQQAGAFKSQVGVRTEKQNQYSAAFITCQFEKAKLDVKVVFDDKNQVTGLWFTPAK